MTTAVNSDSSRDVGLIPSSLPFPVVGIGASAGGLEALLRMFESVPVRPGMAFVIILHLSPDHESAAAEILQRATSMTVSQVRERTAILADHVYVIAPGAELITNDGHIQPAPREWPRRAGVAVDVFFRSLAQVHGPNAICIVLSGTGSDGSVGLVRVKAEGGFCIAQSPEDAQHGGMPRAAIATAQVDLILAASRIGPALVDLRRNGQIVLPLEVEAEVDDKEEAPDRSDSESSLVDILALLRSLTKHDFRHYKRATVVRRVHRRMQLNGTASLAEYREFLKSHPDEARPLLQDMLISVTRFFRDEAAFGALESEIIPQLFSQAAEGSSVRAWVAGCATGEEAYSLGMLLKERSMAQGSPAGIQIFATDIDARALAAARRGVYPTAIAADVDAKRLRQHFVKDQDQYRIAESVREHVLFAQHNLLRDPPFSKLDLICCRNLLIYLDRAAQSVALEIFRYALKPGGYLFLGGSESTDAVGTTFTAVDKKNRIYRVNPDCPPLSAARMFTDYGSVETNPVRPLDSAVTPDLQDLSALTQHFHALMQTASPSVLLDHRHEVLHLSPTAGRFLQRSGGAPSHNILDNVLPEMRLQLRTALFEAAESGALATSRVVQLDDDGNRSVVDIAVHVISSVAAQPPRLLVVFNTPDQNVLTPGDEEARLDDGQLKIVERLEEENKRLKVHVQDIVERSAVSTEELRASNEELQAINEELRSATEELETSKEELQSMNEELVTVNFELNVKVEERGQINDDLQNLISAADISTVFVDGSMRVKRFTPQAATIFNLIASDIGRPLSDITNRLQYPELESEASLVFAELRLIERRVSSVDGRHFFARILPYRTSGDRIEGAVLTFVDVTALRNAEERVLVSEAQLKLAAGDA